MSFALLEMAKRDPSLQCTLALAMASPRDMARHLHRGMHRAIVVDGLRSEESWSLNTSDVVQVATALCREERASKILTSNQGATLWPRFGECLAELLGVPFEEVVGTSACIHLECDRVMKRRRSVVVNIRCSDFEDPYVRSAEYIGAKKLERDVVVRPSGPLGAGKARYWNPVRFGYAWTTGPNARE